MDANFVYHREASRLMRLAQEATTEQVRQFLLQQAHQCEAMALELDMVAQQDEAERMVR
jgi:hypothetical protein